MRRWPFAVALVALGGAGACASLEGLTDGTPDPGEDAGLLDSAVVVDTGEDVGDADAKPTPCSATGTCVPTVLAASQNDPVEIAVKDGFVYWRSNDATISRVATAGSALPVQLSTNANAQGLVVDDTSFYSIHFCTVVATALDGGATSASASVCGVKLLTSNTTKVFTSNGNGSIFKLPKMIEEAGVSGIGTRSGGTFGQIYESGGQVFYTWSKSTGEGEVGYFSSSGPSVALPTTLAPNQTNPRALVVDPTGAAWVTSGNNDGGAGASVLVQALTGDSPHAVSRPDDDPAASALAMDAEYVYYASIGSPPDHTDSKIVRVRRDRSAPPETLVTNEPAVEAIAVDAKAIYWANRRRYEDGGIVPASGKIKSLLKP